MVGPEQGEGTDTGASSNAAILPAEIDALDPVLDTLPSEQRRAIVEVVQQQLSHSGPLPPPNQLADYEVVLPGLAERIVRLTEREQAHRHEIVDLAVRRSARLRDRGQALGMIALLAMLGFCVMLALIGHSATAGVVAVGVIVAVVGIFVKGRDADVREAAMQDDDAD